MADPTPLSSWNAADEAFGPIFVQEGAAGARRQPAPGVQPMPGMPERRPRPQPRPQAAAPQSVSPPAPAPTAPPRPDWNAADEAFGPVFTPPPVGSKLGTSRGDVIGKALRPAYDPLYKDTPAFVHTEGAEDVSTARWVGAKTLAASDASYADVLAAGIPHLNPQITKDANGYPLITYDGENGQRVTAYANKPGIDVEDTKRVLYGSLPFLATGGMAGKVLKNAAAPYLLKIPAQSAVAGVTSGAQDLAAEGIGSNQGGDGAKAIGAMIGGAAGEAITPVFGWAGKKLAERRLFDSAKGTLTQEGMDAARFAGLDPLEMTAEIQKKFAQQLARAGDARAAGVAAETGDLNIPTTLGQRTKDVAQLTREQEMRDGVWGESAAKQMKDFDKRQWDAMVKATMGEIEPGKPGMSMAINPNRSPGDYAPGQIGASIAERSQAGFKVMDDTAAATWRSIGKIEPTDSALAELPRYIANGLGDLAPSENDVALMPVTTAILKQAKAFMEKSPPKQAVDGFLPTTAIADVNRFRQSIGTKIGEMEKGTDKNAAGKVYNAVNDWIREMAEQNLLTATSGDAAVAAANMVTARGLTKNLHAVVEANGNKPGAAIVKKILESADSPEEVVRALFVGPTAKSVKPGSLSAIKSIKEFAGQLPKEEGDMLMSDLKLAYWLQIVRNPAGKEGENIFNPQVMLRNLRVSADAQRSVWHTLFTPQEIAMRNRLTRALENGPTFHDWTIKPNSSRSGTTVGRMFMDMIGGLVGSSYAKVGMEVLNKATGRTRANVLNATRQDLPAVNPTMIGPYFSAGGAAGAQSRE